MTPRSRGTTALKVLLALACAVVLVAGLKSAKVVFVPVLLATFLALLGQAPVAWLRERGCPPLVAALLVGLVTTTALAGVTAGLIASLAELRQEIPRYRDILGELGEASAEALSGLGLDLGGEPLALLDGERWLDLASQAVGNVLNALSFALLVVVFVFFVLLESSDFRRKLRYLAGGGESLARLDKSCRQVRRYLAVKSLMCVLTGAGVGTVFLVADVRFALLWAILAFLFNYVPVLGSVLLAVPPLALTLVDHGMATASVVLIAYVAINLLVSNLLEPLLMGNQLGLSPLAVFLSLVFWGWLWGPVGMLVAVPLTRIAKILLENTRELSWLATLIGRPPRDVAACSAKAHPPPALISARALPSPSPRARSPRGS